MIGLERRRAMMGEYLGLTKQAKDIISTNYGYDVLRQVINYARRNKVIVPRINEDPHLACSIAETPYLRSVHATSLCSALLDVYTENGLTMACLCATDGTTGGNTDIVCGSYGWAGNATTTGSFMVGFDIRGGLGFTFAKNTIFRNRIYTGSIAINTPYLLQLDRTSFNVYSYDGTILYTTPTYELVGTNSYQMTSLYTGVIIYYIKIAKDGIVIRHIVPFSGNNNECLVDLLTGTTYKPSKDTGVFVFDIENKPS